jgi:uncharacterized Zn-binding protein involved in type VI secretion
MPGVTRLGDLTTGHDSFPSRPSIQASDNVLCNGIGVVRVGDAYAVHCNPLPICHGGVLSSGSSSVFINSLPCGRIGDAVSCGDHVAEGSDNVFCG